MTDLLADAETPAPDQPGREEIRRLETDDGISLDYFGESCQTIDELIASQNIDSAIWYVAESEIKQHGVAGKLRQGQNEAGRWLPEKLWQQTVRNIRVKLKRRAPKGIQDGIAELLKNWNPPALPELDYRPSGGEKCAAIFLPADFHFGKRCWAAMSGADYDLGIVRDVFRQMVDQAVSRAGSFNVEKVYFSHMGDFFQANNWAGTTVRGTVVDSVDDRFPKVFDIGFECVDYAIERFRQIAPVEYRHVPGNHDGETSWYLARVLKERFRGDKHVNIDCDPISRKYDLYGVTAWMMTHGDTKKKNLPLTFAQEAPHIWAAAIYRLVFGGHDHTKRTDTHCGVEVHSLASPSPADKWHYDKQFVGNSQESETFVISRDNGPIGRFSQYAQPIA